MLSISNFKNPNIFKNSFKGKTTSPFFTQNTNSNGDTVQFSSNSALNLKNIQLSDEINRGNVAIVYNIKGNDSYVVRIEDGYEFEPKKLKPVNDKSGYIIASDDKGGVTVLKKIEGEPLYGKNWAIYKEPDFFDYVAQLNKLKSLPDTTFKKYMNDIIDLRKSGFDIDTINPGNFLLDSKGNINFVDLSRNKNPENIKPLSIKDFYPLIDGMRVTKMIGNKPDIKSDFLHRNIKEFLDRIVRISQENGTPVEIEPINYDKLQDRITYLYHYDPLLFV